MDYLTRSTEYLELNLDSPIFIGSPQVNQYCTIDTN